MYPVPVVRVPADHRFYRGCESFCVFKHGGIVIDAADNLNLGQNGYPMASAVAFTHEKGRYHGRTRRHRQPRQAIVG
jgi:hypothetical protein